MKESKTQYRIVISVGPDGLLSEQQELIFMTLPAADSYYDEKRQAGYRPVLYKEETVVTATCLRIGDRPLNSPELLPYVTIPDWRPDVSH